MIALALIRQWRAKELEFRAAGYSAAADVIRACIQDLRRTIREGGVEAEVVQ